MRFVLKLFKEVMLPSTASLDLDEVRWGKDGPEESEVEDVGAIVSCGHHADSHTNASFAGLVCGKKIPSTQQLIVGAG